MKDKLTKSEKFVFDFMNFFDENGLGAPEHIMYRRAYGVLEELKMLKIKNIHES